MWWRHFWRRFRVCGGGSDDLFEKVGVAEPAAAPLHLPELFEEGAAAIGFGVFLDLF